MSNFTTADEIEPEAIRWAWKGYLPAGKLVLLDGAPAAARASFCCRWWRR